MDGLAHNHTAERAAIGCVLLDPDSVAKCELQPQHFHYQTYAKAWSDAMKAYKDGLPYDLVSAEQSGLNFTEATQIVADTPSYVNLPVYEKLIMEAYERREAQLFANKLVQAAADKELDVDELRAMASQFATEKPKHDDSVMAWLQMPDVFQSMLDDAATQGTDPYNWPWASWNSLVDSPDPGMLVVMAGADGSGKTIYAENTAEHWARQGARVGFFHLELNRKVMLRRRYARHTGIPVEVFKQGNLTPNQRDKVAEADHLLTSWPGQVDYIHSPGWTMDRIIRTSEIHGYDAVVIDYIQKVAPTRQQLSHSKGNYVQYVPMMVEDLKNYAESTESYAVLLSQLNKHGKAGRPTKDDMRGAGDISEKSNMVMLIWRERTEFGERGPNGEQLSNPGGFSIYTHIIVDKNTMGRTGELKQVLRGARFHILDESR